jgi:hypothetical protein
LADYYDFAREPSGDGAVHYVFTTDTDLVYSVYFNPPDFSDYLEELPLLSQHGCLFGFFPVDEIGSKKSEDSGISATLYKIVEDYFNSYGDEKVLLFHCDSDDGKQQGRDKLFEKWFKKKPADLIISKDGLEVEIEREGGSIKTEYLGFIIHGENDELLQTVKEEFVEISAMIVSRKR